MAKKDWLFWLIVAAILGLIVWGIFALSRQNNQTPQKSQEILNIKDGDWVKGDRQAKNVIIEYSDFECPYCQLSNFYMNRLLAKEDLAGQIAIVYRHFPIPSHTNSRAAAIASEAAGKQNKFWEMHDLLFDKQSEWSSQTDVQTTFTNYAKDLGLNTDQFTQDLNDQKIKDKVAANVADGDKDKLNITYTPTIYLNGEIIELQDSYDKFEQYIRQRLTAN